MISIKYLKGISRLDPKKNNKSLSQNRCVILSEAKNLIGGSIGIPAKYTSQRDPSLRSG
jgi:hypothetical protein